MKQKIQSPPRMSRGPKVNQCSKCKKPLPATRHVCTKCIREAVKLVVGERKKREQEEKDKEK